MQAYTWLIVVHAIVAWLDAYGERGRGGAARSRGGDVVVVVDWLCGVPPCCLEQAALQIIILAPSISTEPPQASAPTTWPTPLGPASAQRRYTSGPPSSSPLCSSSWARCCWAATSPAPSPPASPRPAPLRPRPQSSCTVSALRCGWRPPACLHPTACCFIAQSQPHGRQLVPFAQRSQHSTTDTNHHATPRATQACCPQRPAP